jgi:TonB family protein
MKNTIIVLILSLLSSVVYSQKSLFEYTGRSTSSVKKEMLTAVNNISDIAPDMWARIGLPFKVKEELEHRRKLDERGCFIFYPQGYNYNRLVEYVAVEISATNNGKVLVAQSLGDKLSSEQKNILSRADLDTDIIIKIKFRYKNLFVDNRVITDYEIMEGGLVVTVVPQVEAEYVGGFKQLTAYLAESIISKISEKEFVGKLQNATVNFMVEEEGKVVAVKITRASGDARIDKLILDALSKMPKWKPATDSKATKLKQTFSIPFGGDGC